MSISNPFSARSFAENRAPTSSLIPNRSIREVIVNPFRPNINRIKAEAKFLAPRLKRQDFIIDDYVENHSRRLMRSSFIDVITNPLRQSLDLARIKSEANFLRMKILAGEKTPVAERVNEKIANNLVIVPEPMKVWPQRVVEIVKPIKVPEVKPAVIVHPEISPNPAATLTAKVEKQPQAKTGLENSAVKKINHPIPLASAASELVKKREVYKKEDKADESKKREKRKTSEFSAKIVVDYKALTKRVIRLVSAITKVKLEKGEIKGAEVAKHIHEDEEVRGEIVKARRVDGTFIASLDGVSEDKTIYQSEDEAKERYLEILALHRPGKVDKNGEDLPGKEVAEAYMDIEKDLLTFKPSFGNTAARIRLQQLISEHERSGVVSVQTEIKREEVIEKGLDRSSLLAEALKAAA